MIREQAKRDELAKKYAEQLTDLVKFVKLDNGNFKPDIYTVGPKHIEHASKYHSGMLGEATTEAVGCCRCGQPMSKHVYDTALYVEITRECTEAELKTVLTPAFGAQLEADMIDGIAFSKGFDLIKRPVTT